METDATRMCALLVGLPDVTVVGVGEWPSWLRVVITAECERLSCCGRVAHRHGVREVVLVDLPVFGRPARLVWRKQRWRCPMCRRSWTERQPSIASSRCALTTAEHLSRRSGRHLRLGAKHAQLVAFRVGEDDPAGAGSVLAALIGDLSGAKAAQALDLLIAPAMAWRRSKWIRLAGRSESATSMNSS